MYIETTDQLLLAYHIGETGEGAVDFSVRICNDRAMYTHRKVFEKRADAQHLLERVQAAGQIDLDCWAVDEHGIFDTNSVIDGDEECERCAGTGRFIVGMENGKLLERGTCYRCAGKGYHNRSDRLRNSSHDAHYMGRIS